MITKDFLGRGIENFYTPVLESFSFLVTDYGFDVRGFAESYETVVIYEKNHDAIQICFAIPEFPFIRLQKIDGRVITSEKKHKLKNAGLKKLKKEFDKTRDTLGLEKWHKGLKSRQFDEMITKIIIGLSEEIRETLEDL